MTHDGWVPVFRTADPAAIPWVKSLLDANGIPYVVDGEGATALFPLGPYGARLFRRTLEARFLVPSERATEAETLLAAPPGPPPTPAR